MERANRTVWQIAALLIATTVVGCGGGGGGGGPAFGGEQDGDPAALGLNPPRLRVLWSDPADGAVQVAPDGTLRVAFDAAVLSASLGHPDTGLFAVGPDGDTAVPGRLDLSDDGRELTFTPHAPLAAATAHRLVLSGLTAASQQRLLEGDRAIGFTTLDTQPPSLLAVRPDPALAVDRLATLELAFDEDLAAGVAQPAHAELRDAFDSTWPVDVTTAGAVLRIDPVIDLPGDRDFRLTVTSVADRHGNRRPDLDVVAFRTVADRDPPHVVSIHPDAFGRLSPRGWPRITFHESVDLASIEPGSVVIRDDWGNLQPLRVHASADRRTLWLEPERDLPGGAVCKLLLATGPGGLTDVSGNPLLAASAFHVFETSDDVDPPRLVAAEPAAGALAVPTGTRIAVRFDQAIDPATVSVDVLELTGPDGARIALTDPRLVDGDTLVVMPAVPLAAGAAHTVRLAAGHAALLDLHGLPLATPVTWSFTTASDARPPQFASAPADGRTGVPPEARLVLWCEHPLDPASVADPAVFQLRDALGHDVDVDVALSRGARAIALTPRAALVPGQEYTLTIRGGAGGPRDAETGAPLATDRTLSFRCGFLADPNPPSARLTIDAIDAARSGALAVAPHGFALDLVAGDVGGGGIDWTTAVIELEGPGAAPDGERLFALGRVVDGTFRVRVPSGDALEAGVWTARARVADLSGNLATTAELRFEVVKPDAARLPFERTQVVWVRFDLDRDRNGSPDFRDDLLRLGLCAAGDPRGTNDRMERILRDGVLRRLRELYEREADGERRPSDPSDSVSIVFTDHEPRGVVAMQIACGGFDPEGEPGRGYGDDSSGTLGRAWFDHRNAAVDQHATATAPGLGVFPAELWLFETAVHRSVYPSFVTRFARHFLPLAPELGGTPAGAWRDDGRVLAAGFDPSGATPSERARWQSVFDAADAWATAIGTIAAHEVGHALGLVAAGQGASALHGDATLHNEFAGIGDVMAASVGYDAMTSIPYRFRDLNLAYLRQRVLLK